MKVKAYVKIIRDSYGTVGLSISKSKPDAKSNEVVALLNFDIPDSLFAKPLLEANIVVKAPPTTSVPTITIESGALVDWIEDKK
jgi:hypothetical protein